ncbi:Glycosyl transferase, group 1 [Minicystis rosea]|nr:Glycosyl transferase, group 1 [Minicystis rosea]
MRILHVLDRSLPSIAGYTTRSAAILEHQAAIGMSPRALTGVRQGGGPELIRGIEYQRTDPPDLLALLDRAPVARETVEMATLGRRIMAAHRASPVDVIHAHSPILCGIPAHLAARRLGLPSVYEIRAFWEDAAEQRGRGRPGSARYTTIRTLETAVCRSVDAVVTICEGLRRDLVARGIPDDRMFVVPNGVDTERFVARPRDPDLEERLGFRNKTVVAYIGTLFRFEGVPLLLSALGRLLDARDDVRGLIVGHGEAEADVHAAVENLGLGGRVAVIGKAQPDEVARYYSLADILCYPRARHRITELVTPLKPLEAMSMGKAVVASDVGGLRELVTNEETGLLFKAGDAEALAGVLARVIGDNDLRRRLNTRARAHVVAERSFRSIAARYVEVYAAAEQHLARHKAPSSMKAIGASRAR